jgi:hypothetical protein
MNKDLLFDKRLIDRHIRLGYITQEDVDKHLTEIEEGSQHPEYKGHEVALLSEFNKNKEVKWVPHLKVDKK